MYTTNSKLQKSKIITITLHKSQKYSKHIFLSNILSISDNKTHKNKKYTRSLFFENVIQGELFRQSFSQIKKNIYITSTFLFTYKTLENYTQPIQPFPMDNIENINQNNIQQNNNPIFNGNNI